MIIKLNIVSATLPNPAKNSAGIVCKKYLNKLIIATNILPAKFKNTPYFMYKYQINLNIHTKTAYCKCEATIDQVMIILHEKMYSFNIHFTASILEKCI